jgi:hypothetical protein
MTTFPTGQGHSGATNPPNPNPSVNPSGNDRSGDLRRDLADRINRAWDEWAADEVPGWRQEYIADAILAAGYRRVVEDDTTVERVAVALCDLDGLLWPEEGEVEAAAQAGLSCTIADTDLYRRRARAAVRALREDTP